MPSSSRNGSQTAGNSGESSPTGDDDGIDVNVSVSGQNIPIGSPLPGGLPGEGGAGMPGMPGGGMPGLPGSTGGMPGMPGSSGGMPGMPGSTAGLPGADGTGSTASSGMPGGSNDPFGGLGRAGGSGNGPMTAAERRAVLDARLEEGYAVFDGMILGERERAQRDANAAGSGVMSPGGGAGGQDGDGGFESGAGGMGNASIIVASNEAATRGSGAGVMGAGSGRRGEYDAENAAATYPVPEDIPSGNDDDVVARQLREAAMREPDPELREKLWDEYRKYTGLSR